MSPLHPPAVELEFQPAGAFGPLAIDGFAQHAIKLEPREPAQQVALREPSSLGLALVGFAMLVAFRGIQKRLPGSEVKRSDLIKPRRRAA